MCFEAVVVFISATAHGGRIYSPATFSPSCNMQTSSCPLPRIDIIYNTSIALKSSGSQSSAEDQSKRGKAVSN